MSSDTLWVFLALGLSARAFTTISESRLCKRTFLAMGNTCAAPIITNEMNMQVGLPPQKKANSPCVAMIYYSTYGHVKQLAEEIKRGT